MDKSILEFRAKGYYAGHTKGASTILYSGFTTEFDANEILRRWTEAGIITGGHLERHIQGIGWVLADDTSDEPEPIPPHSYN